MALGNASPLAVFLCQVLAIVVFTATLMVAATAIVVTFANVLANYDSSMIIPMAIAVLVPLCLSWWLYTKALRRLASRLNLAIASSALGIPIIGEMRVLAAMISQSYKQ